jgi:hypothetical protein
VSVGLDADGEAGRIHREARKAHEEEEEEP